MDDESPIRALLIEDEPHRAAAMLDLLHTVGAGSVDVAHVDETAAAFEQLAREPFHVVLFGLPTSADAAAHVDMLLADVPYVPLIVLAETADAEMALPMLRNGVQDFWIHGRDTGPALLRAMQFAMARKSKLDRLKRQANYDLPTGLPNRYLFDDRLAHAAARATRCGTPLAVLFLDLDGFKRVNDSFGHSVGDRVLRAVGKRLTRTARASDTVARIGGDEFAVILESLTRPEDAGMVAQKLLNTLAEPFVESEHRIDLSCSIGISFFLFDGTDAESLLAHADRAMYRSKQLGGNRYSECTEDLSPQVLARFQVVSGLGTALEREELRLFFQPQLEAASGTIRGVEAMVHWQHPEYGLLRPQAFMAVARDSALTEPFDTWVLSSACERLARWKAAGLPPVQLAINLSPQHLVEGDLGERITAVLDDTGLPASVLEIDIDSTPVGQEAKIDTAILCDLKDRGVKLVLNQFGGGHSLLSHLWRLPVDIVKLDRTLIHAAGTQRSEKLIARMVSDLAHSLSLTVAAVGVESPVQLTSVSEVGCDVFQGDLISPPLDASAITGCLRDGPSRLPGAAVLNRNPGPRRVGARYPQTASS